MRLLIHNPPNRFRFHRHIQMLHAKRRQRINDRADDRRRRADRSRFANAFYAERIHRRRRLRSIQLQPGNVRRPSAPRSPSTPGDQLALLVVNHFFIQRLTDRLHDAAVNLSVDQHRVDHLAAIIDRDVTQKLDVAGFAIDFDDDDVRAEGKREFFGSKK